MNTKSRFITSVNIRRKRRELDLTQKQLADRIGVRYQYIQKWEGGTKPSIEFINKIAKALDVDVEWLLTENEQEAKIESPLTKQDIKEAVKEALLESQVVICPLAEKHKYRGR